MLGLGTVTRLLGARPAREVDTCLVCHEGVREDYLYDVEAQ